MALVSLTCLMPVTKCLRKVSWGKKGWFWFKSRIYHSGKVMAVDYKTNGHIASKPRKYWERKAGAKFTFSLSNIELPGNRMGPLTFQVGLLSSVNLIWRILHKHTWSLLPRNSLPQQADCRHSLFVSLRPSELTLVSFHTRGDDSHGLHSLFVYLRFYGNLR